MNSILKSILQAKIIFLKRKGSEHPEEGREMLKGKENYGVKETMSAKARADTAYNAFKRVICFGWPNQPFSSMMENLQWKCLYIK